MEPAVRIERTTSRLQGERCYQLSYAGELCACMTWRASQVSNLQPPVLETGVLPIELDTQCWLVWSPKQASNLHDFRRRILSPVRLPIPPSGVIPFRLCLHAIPALARPRRHRCTWLGPDRAHPSRPPTRLASGGAAKAHPKWSSRRASNPRPQRWRRCALPD